MRAEPQRSLVFGFSIGREAAPRVKISERRTRLGPIGVEALGSDELGRRALERFAIGGRVACARNRGEQCRGVDAHAAIGIGKQRRNEWLEGLKGIAPRVTRGAGPPGTPPP